MQGEYFFILISEITMQVDINRINMRERPLDKGRLFFRMQIAKYYGTIEMESGGRAKSKIPYSNLDERATSITECPSRFHHSSFQPTTLWLKIAFSWIRCAAVRNGLEREDQQDDDEHRAGEESDCAPLAAV